VTSEMLGGLDRADSLAMLVAHQLEAIDAWNVARELRQALCEAPPGMTREARLDAARRLDVLRRVHEAMLARTSDFLARRPGPLQWPLQRRAVVAHRQEWFVNQLTGALREHGITAVAATDNGADALGLVVAEQPDLLLVEEKLAMLSGLELVAEAAVFAPQTVVAAQVRNNDDVADMLDAGAALAFARQMPPVEVAKALAEMINGVAAD
jgi:CheY-like chemotaxis protein